MATLDREAFARHMVNVMRTQAEVEGVFKKVGMTDAGREAWTQEGMRTMRRVWDVLDSHGYYVGRKGWKANSP